VFFDIYGRLPGGAEVPKGGRETIVRRSHCRGLMKSREANCSGEGEKH